MFFLFSLKQNMKDSGQKNADVVFYDQDKRLQVQQASRDFGPWIKSQLGTRKLLVFRYLNPNFYFLSNKCWMWEGRNGREEGGAGFWTFQKYLKNWRRGRHFTLYVECHVQAIVVVNWNIYCLISGKLIFNKWFLTSKTSRKMCMESRPHVGSPTQPSAVFRIILVTLIASLLVTQSGGFKIAEEAKEVDFNTKTLFEGIAKSFSFWNPIFNWLDFF